MAKKLITKNNKLIKVDGQILAVEVEDTLKKLLDTTKSTSYMFSGNTNITNIDGLLNYNDTENVTNMSNMFSECTNLTTLPALNTEKVTNMNAMFYKCSQLTNVDWLKTPEVTEMQSTFRDCKSLVEIPMLDTSNVTKMYYLFSGCSNLKTIPPLNTTKVTDMERMFNQSSVTTIPPLDMSNVTRASYMFYGSYNLERIPPMNMNKLTSWYNFFYSCGNLIEVPEINMPAVTEATDAFYGCKKLSRLGPLKTEKIYNMKRMLSSCRRLRFVEFSKWGEVSSSSYTQNFLPSRGSLKYVVIRDMSQTPTLDSTAMSINSFCSEEGAGVYVPDDMVSTLKNTTNWSSVADFIYPISALPEDYLTETFVSNFTTIQGVIRTWESYADSYTPTQFKFGNFGEEICDINIYVGSDNPNLSIKLDIELIKGDLKYSIYEINSTTNIIKTFIKESKGDSMTVSYTIPLNNLTKGFHTLRVSNYTSTQQQDNKTTVSIVKE